MGPRWAKGTLRSKDSKGYLKVQGWQRVPKDPRFAKGTKWSKVGKEYLKAKGINGCPPYSEGS